MLPALAVALCALALLAAPLAVNTAAWALDGEYRISLYVPAGRCYYSYGHSRHRGGYRVTRTWGRCYPAPTPTLTTGQP